MKSENDVSVAVFNYNRIAKEHLVIQELRERIAEQEAMLENLRQAYKLARSQTPDIVAATYHTVGQLIDDYATASIISDTALQAVIALQMVIQERRRQIASEGFDAKHDDRYKADELARAAVCYALPSMFHSEVAPWPFDSDWFKPSEDKKRNIVKAIALLVAEHEWRLRAENITD